MPTITIEDLNNGKKDVDHIRDVATSPLPTAVDRFGDTKPTVAGAMAKLTASADAVEAQVAPAQAAIASSVDAAVQASATTVQQFREMLEDISIPEDFDATMVAFEGRSVQLALKDMPTIQQFGGAGDFDPANPSSYTNNYDALVAAINVGYVAGRPRGRNIRLPFIMGRTNQYRMEGGSIPRGYITLVPDRGVKIISDTVPIDDLIVGSVDYNGSGTTFSAYGDPRSGMGELNRPEYLKSRWIADSERYRNLTATVSPAANSRAAKVQWPGGALESDWVADTETTLNGSSAIFAPSTGDSRIHVDLYRLKVGETISAQILFANGQTGFIPWVLARTAMGHHGINFDAGNNGVAEVGKRYGQAETQVAVSNIPGLAQHQSYFGALSQVELRRDSLVGFSVMFNGLVVLQYEFPEPILEFAFGGFASTATTFTWTNFARKIGGPRLGAKTRMVHVIGDSRSADRYDAWPRFFKDAANGSGGIRVPRVTNQGVPGHDSTAQRAILAARAGQAGYTAHGFPLWTTDALIAVITNDIQSGSNPATSRNNLVDMVSWAIADGIVPFLGIPEVWYQRGNSGGSGQPTLNYAAGTPYRAAVQSVAAQFGLVTVDDGVAMGPLIANYVNPALTPYLGAPTTSIPDAPNADPMLMDNIHPGAFAGRIKGGNWAKAFLGYHAGMHPSSKSDWQVLDPAYYLTGWSQFSQDPLRWRLLPDARVQWGGVALGSADGSVITIPQGLRPFRAFRGLAFASNGPVRLQVLSTADITGFPAGSNFVDFSNLVYDLAD